MQRTAASAPRRLSELIAVPPELVTTLDPPVELVFAVDDLHRAIEHDCLAREEIVAYVETTRTLLFFAVRPDPREPDPSTKERLEGLRSRFETVRHRLGYEAAQTLLYYLTNAFRYRSRVHDILLEPIREEIRSKMSTTYHEQLKAGAIAVMRERLIEEARTEGWEDGLEQGREDGLEDGLKQGRALAMLQCLEQLLRARGLLDDVARGRLEQTRDEARLLCWLTRAATASTSAEVFTDS